LLKKENHILGPWQDNKKDNPLRLVEMVLESTFICVDNSDFMRNGDFLPTRLAAQHDAVNVVCNYKTRGNPENNVGLLTMAGKRVEVLSTLTTDTGRIMAKLHLVRPEGAISFSSAIRVAHLALKHRQGKNHKTRIVVFVGSPVDEDEKELEKLAKKLKKEKVNVDVVNFGEISPNTDKLSAFVTALNGKEGQTSYLVTVPPGPTLSDSIRDSPIVKGEDGVGGGESGGGGNRDFDFGVDADADPELALALRVSMEEQRQRQEEEARKNAAAPKERQPAINEDDEDDEEAAQLAAALALSRQNDDGGSTRPVPSIPDFASMSEEEQIAMAMQMSLQAEEAASSSTPAPPNPPAAPKKPAKRKEDNENKNNSEDRKRPRESEGSGGGSNPTTPGRQGNEEKKPRVVAGDENDDDEDYSDVINDPAFLQSVLENLPGVDPQSDAIKDAVSSLSAGEAKKNKDDKKDSKDK